MRLNTAGISINTSLYVSGTTTSNSTTTCRSSLAVSGTTTSFQGFVGIGNNEPFNTGAFDVGGNNNNTTYYSYLNKLRIAGNDPNTIWQT
jgi:hypothetical protein